MGRRAKRDETAIIKRRSEVARLYLAGVDQVAIAERLAVDQSTVSRDLAALRKEWSASATADIGDHIAEALARLDALERAAWQAWERSGGKRQTVREKKGGPGTGKDTPVEVTTTTEVLTGDPRYLERVHSCIERRCRLLGLDKPTGVDITSKGEVCKIYLVGPNGATPMSMV